MKMAAGNSKNWLELERKMAEKMDECVDLVARLFLNQVKKQPCNEVHTHSSNLPDLH